MPVTNLFSGVQTRLDESGGAVFFTAQQIYDALNETLLMVFAAGKWTTAGTSLTLPTNTDLISIPTGVFIPQYILIGGLKYFTTTMAKLEQYDRFWRLAPQGKPSHFVLWDYQTLRVWPRPDQAYSSVLWGLPYPNVEITNDNQSVDLPTLLSDAVIYLAVSELLEHTHPNLADRYESEGNDYLKAFGIQFRKRQGHNISRLRPATTFQRGQSGVIGIGRTSNLKSYYTP